MNETKNQENVLMNVKRIIVDELPESCRFCPISDLSPKNYGNHCTIMDCRFNDDRGLTPDWCPLEVEEECEWGTHTFDELADGDWKYCPNCGKKIKYVEVERRGGEFLQKIKQYKKDLENENHS